jgi:hypothetical protein
MQKKDYPTGWAAGEEELPKPGSRQTYLGA